MQDRDFDWFLENYDRLYKEYGNAYLAIKNQKVLGKYPTYAMAVRKTAKKEPVGTFIVQYCDGSPEAYTVRIPSMSFAGRCNA